MPQFYRLPKFIQSLLGGTALNFPDNNQGIYLTFDDGPHPDSTPEILRILDKFSAKASFFCTGKNAEMYPEQYLQILLEGHSTANHSYSHLNGWKSKAFEYINDVEKASGFVKSEWFRPPYGRLSIRQWLVLKKKYKIIFWDLLFKDYSKDFDPLKAFKKAQKYLTPGSVIVMHDSPLSFEKTKVLLPLVLNYLKENRVNIIRIEDASTRKNF